MKDLLSDLGGAGFMRMNNDCPRSRLVEVLNKIEAVIYK